MFVLIGSIFVGVAGVAAAGWYALGPQQSYGLVNPKRWTFATTGTAKATLTMNMPSAQKALVPLRNGYSYVNVEDGFQVKIDQNGATPDTVSMRNVISFDKNKAPGDLTFSFQATSPAPFPVTFVIRDSGIKSGGGLIWSHSFSVDGDWKDYSATVPLGNLDKGKMQYMVVAGHLGNKNGVISLRKIYLK